MRTAHVVAMLLFAGCGSSDAGDVDDGPMSNGPAESVDVVAHTCEAPEWTPGTCAPGEVTRLVPAGNSHVELPTPIEYEDNPPASGDHRGTWARWGEYAYLPPQRWLHNLEHGGVAFLYHPCAPTQMVDELREFARSRPNDDGGEFRWVMTPYPGLPTAIAAVSWTWTYEAECVDPVDMDQFTANHYRRAPEDVDADGNYDELWIGK